MILYHACCAKHLSAAAQVVINGWSELLLDVKAIQAGHDQ
jgi:hypothetical protein